MDVAKTYVSKKPAFVPRKVTRPLREYYCAFDGERLGKKVQAPSAECAVRLFLNSTDRDGGEMGVLVAQNGMRERGDFYRYILMGIPSPARRMFTGFNVVSAEDVKTYYYIFKCLVCKMERVYGCTDGFVRPVTNRALLDCERCSFTHRRVQSLHLYVEAVGQKLRDEIIRLAHKKWSREDV